MSLYKRQIAIISIGIILLIVLKLIFRSSNTNQLFYFIYPTNTLFSLVSNSHWEFIQDIGFFHRELNILIDKSCSGGHFFIMITMITYTCFVHQVKSWMQVLVFLIYTFCTSWALTTIANCSRIYIITQINTTRINEIQWTHEAIGSGVYLIFLLSIYIAYQKIIKSQII